METQCTDAQMDRDSVGHDVGEEPFEQMPVTEEGARAAWRYLIRYLGDDPDREGLRETPDRILRSWKTVFSGYTMEPQGVSKSFTDHASQGIIGLTSIDFCSVCEHHLQPFFGQLYVAYLPGEEIVGVSKLVRIAEVFTRRLQLQERMTAQIADAYMTCFRPKGVLVGCKARHFCMIARGVERRRSLMITSEVRGDFYKHGLRQEFLTLAFHKEVW